MLHKIRCIYQSFFLPYTVLLWLIKLYWHIHLLSTDTCSVRINRHRPRACEQYPALVIVCGRVVDMSKVGSLFVERGFVNIVDGLYLSSALFTSAHQRGGRFPQFLNVNFHVFISEKHTRGVYNGNVRRVGVHQWWARLFSGLKRCEGVFWPERAGKYLVFNVLMNLIPKQFESIHMYSQLLLIHSAAKHEYSYM